MYLLSRYNTNTEKTTRYGGHSGLGCSANPVASGWLALFVFFMNNNDNPYELYNSY